MARIDKYDPIDGGFRAPIAADTNAHTGAIGGSNIPVGVGLDTSGRVVPGAGNTGIVGVLCLPRNVKAGDIVDVMTDGEILEIGGTAGTTYYINTTTGALETTAPAAGTNKPKAGHTVEAGRLVVRFRDFQG